MSEGNRRKHWLPAAGDTGSCKPLCECWEPNLGSLQELFRCYFYLYECVCMSLFSVCACHGWVGAGMLTKAEVAGGCEGSDMDA